jgi:hypothetical protein
MLECCDEKHFLVDQIQSPLSTLCEAIHGCHKLTCTMDDYQFYFKVDSRAYVFLEKTCTLSIFNIIFVIIYLPNHVRGFVN